MKSDTNLATILVNWLSMFCLIHTQEENTSGRVNLIEERHLLDDRTRLVFRMFRQKRFQLWPDIL